MKEQENDKNEFVTKFVEIMVKLLSHKNISEKAGKIVVTHCFSLIACHKKL